MRRFCLILYLLSIPAIAWSDPVNPQAQVSAAMESAVDRLARDIQAEPITSSLNIKTFLDRTDSQPKLIEVLQQAQQIGGPRWIDEQTCQVRFDISADIVRRALWQIATDSRKTSPIPPDDLLRDLKNWDSRTFSALGTSTQLIDLIRPPASSLAWRDASAPEILQAVTLARQDAVNQVLHSISPVPLAGGKNIGDALAIVSVQQTLAQWIAGRPITLVDFRDDHRVEITLSLSPAEFYEKFRSLVKTRSDIPLPADEKGWSVVADGIAKQMASPIGQSPPAMIGGQSTQPAGVTLPNQPPDWAFRQIDAQGSGMGQTQLLSARAAQFAATRDLRHQIDQLPMGDNRTVKDLAAGDHRIAEAVDRALSQSAHVYSIDYQTDGSVNVRMSLDLQDLWDAMTTAR